MTTNKAHCHSCGNDYDGQTYLTCPDCFRKASRKRLIPLAGTREEQTRINQACINQACGLPTFRIDQAIDSAIARGIINRTWSGWSWGA